jgi:plastocyanin
MIARSHPRSFRVALAGLAAALSLAAAPVTTVAATYTVKMGFNDFNPASLTIARGDKVLWKNPKNMVLAHDVTSTAPAGYFKSGSKGGMQPGDTFEFTLPAAGRFLYTCREHNNMDGSVTVGIGVKRLYSPARFRVTVASRSASGNWRHEVQVQRPGASGFTRIARTTSATVTFTPTTRGTYRFRSRLTNISSGADSGWSPVKAKTY